MAPPFRRMVLATRCAAAFSLGQQAALSILDCMNKTPEVTSL